MTSNLRPEPDQVLVDIADYVSGHVIRNAVAFETARLCLMDALGCAFLSLDSHECLQHLGPIVPGTIVPNGSRVPGTQFVLDPVQSAFNIGCMIRWLDYNDTWLAAEWGHPSDNLGGILAVADYASSLRRAARKPPLYMRDVLTAAIKAYEIQGVLALRNSFNRVGLDHVLLVKVATSAVATWLLGGTREQIINAVSHAWIDSSSLRTYRHAPNTVWRKSWAAGDAASRGVRLAMMAVKGEMGCPSALTAATWGVYDACFDGRPFVFDRRYDSYVVENILFKVSWPAEFHAQTALECALRLHTRVRDHLDEIERISIFTQEAAIRIIDKTGPLDSAADRDHCLQYIVATGLVFGELTSRHYEDEIAADPRIDALRSKMEVVEDLDFSRNYLDPGCRSVANAIQVYFTDGTATERVTQEYPLGHRRRRSEALPELRKKFAQSVYARFPPAQAKAIQSLFDDQERLEAVTVDGFMQMLAI